MILNSSGSNELVKVISNNNLSADDIKETMSCVLEL